MAKTVVGLFDNFDDAQAAVRDLMDSGFSRNDISLVANDASGKYASYGQNRAVGGDKMDDTDAEQAGSGALAGAGVGAVLGLLVGLGALAIPGIGPVIAAGPIATALGSTALGAGLGAAAGGLVGPLVDAGVPRPEAEVYSEGVRRGGTLVTVNSSDDMAHTAAQILERHNVSDIDERGDHYRQSGWSGFDHNAQPYSADELNRFSSSSSTTTNMSAGTATRNTNRTNTIDREGETVLPVVEEDIQIGKRQVQGGGARVRTYMTERPVEEQVQLREEHVHVERRPVDRAASDADINAFKEQTFEVTETREEAVVAKTARVIEEVVIDKDVTQRTETIRDTVRRTDVDVDTLNAGSTSSTGSNVRGFESYDKDFRNYYQSNLANSGYTYEQYTPVYRYGYTIANDENYRGRSWNEIESDARTRWEERNPGTWEQFKDSVRYAWQRVSGQR